MDIQRMNLGTLIDRGALYIEKLSYGFEQYPYDILEGDFVQYYSFLTEAFAWNSQENSFADFYLAELSEKKQMGLMELLSEGSRGKIGDLDLLKGQPYYSLDMELLGALLEVTYKELLFSTFYFTRFKCTIWGNYEGRFPIFYENKFTQKLYRKRIEENTGLILEKGGKIEF